MAVWIEDGHKDETHAKYHVEQQRAHSSHSTAHTALLAGLRAGVNSWFLLQNSISQGLIVALQTCNTVKLSPNFQRLFIKKYMTTDA